MNPLYLADEGNEALLDQLPHLLGVGNTVVSAHCNVHSSSLPPSVEGGVSKARQLTDRPSVKGPKRRRNFLELRTSEIRRIDLFPGTSVDRTKIAGPHAGDLRAHTAVIIQHWVQ